MVIPVHELRIKVPDVLYGEEDELEERLQGEVMLPRNGSGYFLLLTP